MDARGGFVVIVLLNWDGGFTLFNDTDLGKLRRTVLPW